MTHRLMTRVQKVLTRGIVFTMDLQLAACGPWAPALVQPGAASPRRCPRRDGDADETADRWLLQCHDADMTLVLRVGEKFEMKGRTITVSKMQADVGPQVRDYLVEVARRGGTVTYGNLRDDLNLTYPPNGLGRLLDVISEDCHRRGEPSLAPLVVNKATGEAGSDYDGHPESDRQALYGYWS